MRYNKKERKPCGVLPFFLTSFSQPGPAGTIHLKQAAKAGKHHTRRKVFFVSWFSQPELSRTSIFTFFLRIHLHSQNLPEAYSWMRDKKQTQNQNLPEAYTWMRYNKKEGEPCGVLPFFLTSFSQPGPAVPEPYTSIRPKRTPEHITPEWMRYNKKEESHVAF